MIRSAEANGVGDMVDRQEGGSSQSRWLGRSSTRNSVGGSDTVVGVDLIPNSKLATGCFLLSSLTRRFRGFVLSWLCPYYGSGCWVPCRLWLASNSENREKIYLRSVS